MKIIVNNLAVEYKDEGRGPVILMLHGWMRSMGDFEKITEELAQKFRIIRLDLPGFGKTERPKEVWSVSNYTDFVKNFLEKIEVKPDFVLGHSFGGRIILKNQFGAKKIILISSAGIKTDDLQKNFLEFLVKIGKLVTLVPPISLFRGKIRNLLYKISGSDYLESSSMREIFKIVVKEDLSDYAQKVDISTLIIWGEKDFVTTSEQAEKLHKLITNSKLEIISNTGHFSHLERPKEVVKLIEAFLL